MILRNTVNLIETRRGGTKTVSLAVATYMQIRHLEGWDDIHVNEDVPKVDGVLPGPRSVEDRANQLLRFYNTLSHPLRRTFLSVNM
jgi:hypothetical protein